MTPKGGKSLIGAVTNKKGGKMGKKDDESNISPYKQTIIMLVMCLFIALVIMWLGQ